MLIQLESVTDMGARRISKNEARERALNLMRTGMSDQEVHEQTGFALGTIERWHYEYDIPFCPDQQGLKHAKADVPSGFAEEWDKARFRILGYAGAI